MTVKCIDPSEIAEGDLMAYLAGDASAAVSAHIQNCPACTEQVEQLRVVDGRLLARFYRQACPEAEVLADFALNRLSAPDKLRVAAHVRDCPHCSEEAASVRGLVDEEPPSLLERLREMLALALVAQPVAPTAMPVRGKGWQGRFEVDDFVITLSAQAGTLTGRVRRRDGPAEADHSGEAWLLVEGLTDEDIAHCEVDGQGRFQIATRGDGVFSLLLQVGEQNIALDKVSVA
jgi:anti-sigma factor RsiW